MIDKIKNVIFDRSVIRFIIVGGCCTLVDFIIYICLFNQLGAALGKTISMGSSMIINYFLNKFWSFKTTKTRVGREISRYIIAQIINVTVNVFVNLMVLNITNMKIIAFVFATGIAMIVNYCLQRFWVFRKC